MAYEIKYIGGNCPVQAEGTINGFPFYFRARGRRWSFRVADTPDGDPVGGKGFYYDEDYGTGPFEAGYMPESEAIVFIDQAARLYESEVLWCHACGSRFDNPYRHPPEPGDPHINTQTMMCPVCGNAKLQPLAL